MTGNDVAGVAEKHGIHVDDERILAVFSQNVGVDHPKVHALPVGIANRMWPHGQFENIEHALKQSDASKKDLALHFTPAPYAPSRERILSALQNNGYAGSELPLPDYYLSIASSRFTVCPLGNGPDTHRLWEALYLGSVPLAEFIPAIDSFSTFQYILLKTGMQ
jgi:hypothetical protein